MNALDKLYDSLASEASGRGNAKVLVTKAAQLSEAKPAVTSDNTNEDVRDVFARNDKLEAIVVNEEMRPIGLINRNIFMEQYARPFAREVFGRKSCIAFMDKHPLIVDANTPIELLVRSAVGMGGKVLKDGFITTNDGLYSGLGTGFALMEAMSEIEAEKTRQLLSSINYASLIQQSHLAESNHVLEQQAAEKHMLWWPRDVVGGDAYFFRQTDKGLVGCVFDCTGHGVPGAFMTLIVLSFLEQTFDSSQVPMAPGEALTRMNRYIKRVLQQKDLVADAEEDPKQRKASNDGLDAALFLLAPDGRKLDYAAAKLQLIVVPQEGEPILLDGDRHGIGYHDTPMETTWHTRQADLLDGSLLAISTDGIIDQVGGPKSIAHGKRRLLAFLHEHRQLPVSQMVERFQASFSDWQGTQRRRDDVSLFLLRS